MKNTLFAVVGLFVLFLMPAFFSTSSASLKEVPRASISLKEALGQTLFIGFEGKEMNQELEALIKKLQPGGMLLLGKTQLA